MNRSSYLLWCCWFTGKTGGLLKLTVFAVCSGSNSLAKCAHSLRLYSISHTSPQAHYSRNKIDNCVKWNHGDQTPVCPARSQLLLINMHQRWAEPDRRNNIFAATVPDMTGTAFYISSVTSPNSVQPHRRAVFHRQLPEVLQWPRGGDWHRPNQTLAS